MDKLYKEVTWNLELHVISYVFQSVKSQVPVNQLDLL